MAKSKMEQGKMDDRRNSGSKTSGSYGNGKARGGKPNRNRRRSDAKQYRREAEIDGTANAMAGNDPAWYMKDTGLIEAGANFFFPTPVGEVLDITKPGSTNLESGGYRIPGIAIQYWAPSVGVSNDKASAINISAIDLFAEVRRTNAGSANYDPADLMMYVLAMDSLFSFVCTCERAYGVAARYMPTNRYMAEALLTALGFDANQVYRNLAQFRYYINLMVNKLQRYAIPAVFSVYQRHSWLNSTVWADVDNQKAQLMAWVQAGYWAFDNTSETGTSLVYEDVTSTQFTPTTAYNYFNNTLLKAVSGDQDIAIMSGDILKCYGDNIYKMAEMPSDYKVPIMHSEEVLMQWNNATIMGWPSEWDVTQDPSINSGAIIFNPMVGGNSELPYFAGVGSPASELETLPLLTIRSDSPTAVDTLVATRMTSMRKYDATQSTLTITECGTEVVCALAVVTSPVLNGTYPVGLVISNPALVWNNSVPTADAVRLWAYAGAVSQFDWHPITPMVTATTTSGTTTYTLRSYLGDLNNTMVVQESELRRMHDIALMSEFYAKG